MVRPGTPAALCTALVTLVLGALVLGGPVLGGPVLGGPALGGPVLGGQLLVAGLPLQDTPSAAVKRLRRTWDRGPDATILMDMTDLARHDHPATVEALLDVLASDRVAFHPTARRILSGYADTDALKFLAQRGLRHRRAQVREQCVLALGNGRPTGLDWHAALVEALDDRDARVRAAAVHALGRAHAADVTVRLFGLAEDPSPRVRAQVAWSLTRLAGARARPVLAGLAEDPRWRVRLAAADGLANLKTPRAIAALLDTLEHEPGRLREDVLAHLQRLTGRTYGLNIARWRAFLHEAPADFLERADETALAPPQYAGGYRYHSVQTLSRRFALLTDLSGSMSARVTVRSSYDGVERPRIDVTRNELERLIGAIDDQVFFNLVTFTDEAETWRSALVPANARHRREARAVVQRYQASGATNIHAALRWVLDQAEGAVDANSDGGEDIDTAFLLTDGVPTEGDIRNMDLLLDYVAERNRSLRVRIHCISLTSQPDARHFLERLAALTGGVYAPLVD